MAYIFMLHCKFFFLELRLRIHRVIPEHIAFDVVVEVADVVVVKDVDVVVKIVVVEECLFAIFVPFNLFSSMTSC